MDYRVVGTKTLLYGILKLHTLLGTFLLSVGTKTLLYDILKLQTLVTHPNVSLVPKNRVFMFLKVHTPSLIDFLGRLACLSTSQ